MKLVGLFAGALAGVSAQNPSALARLYSQNVERSGNARATMFAKALEAKIEAYQNAGLEIPAHVTQTVLASVAGGGVARASPFCPTVGGCTATISLSQIWSYGCWCMLATPDEGSGLTLDGYDAACRDMVKCNQCAAIDTPGCDAASTGFQVNVAWDTANMGFAMDCSGANPGNWCAEHLCSCEMSFFSTVLDLLWAGTPRTEAFNRNSNFDTDQCLIEAGTGAPNPGGPDMPGGTCCGTYPDRKEILGGWACCYKAGTSGADAGGTRMNSQTQECCTDGSVKDIGDC